MPLIRDDENYADLEDITRIVDPIILPLGLSYTWDSEFGEKAITTTCYLKHVGGGKRSAKFACQASGTKIMNSAQQAGSATTYGQRYSLLAVLGISTDRDDDARGMPAPEADPNQPIVPTREERQASIASKSAAPQSVPSPITADQLKDLLATWKESVGRNEPTQEAFAYWVDVALGYQEPSGKSWLKTSMWDQNSVAICMEKLK